MSGGDEVTLRRIYSVLSSFQLIDIYTSAGESWVPLNSGTQKVFKNSVRVVSKY
jgi:hypothetical protein